MKTVERCPVGVECAGCGKLFDSSELRHCEGAYARCGNLCDAETPDEVCDMLFAEDYETAYELHRPLGIAFMAGMDGILTYRGKQIPANVESCDFAVSSPVRVHSFLISLLCPSPYWQELHELLEDGASYAAVCEFPFEFTEEPSFEFGARKVIDQLQLLNSGDIPCGAEFIFLARNSSVTNPRITMESTGELLQLDTTIQAGQSISVFTHFMGERVVRYHGITSENAFALLGDDSSFLQLPPGHSNMHLRADAGFENLEVMIKYRPLYLGA